MADTPFSFRWGTVPETTELPRFIREANGAFRQIVHDYQNNLTFRNRAVTISALWTFQSTTTQGKWAYDGSNYVTLTVGSTGGVTLDATGAGAAFIFSDGVTCNNGLSVGGTGPALATTVTSGVNSTFRYDASNRLDVSVGSTGIVTLDAVGSGATFSFSDPISVATLNATTRVTSPLLGTVTAVDVVFDRNSVTQLTLGSLLATFAGDITVASGKVYKVNGTQVVSAQGAAVADASGGAVIDAEARTALNALLARVRTHGLIAT